MKNFLTLAVLLCSLMAVSQTSYMPGYFISNDGQRTQCLIKSIGWKNNPVYFDYKVPGGSETKTAAIDNVAEFNVDGYKFVRYTVGIDRSGTLLSNLSAGKEPEFKQETLFLKILVEGPATLYQYEDRNLVRYFYKTTQSTPEQLVYKIYKEDETKIAYNYAFRGQLFNAMNNGISDRGRFKNLIYSKDDLVKLFIDYNPGSGAAVVKNLSASQNKSDINIRVTPGVNFISAPITNTALGGSGSKTDFGTKAALMIGLEAEVVLPFNNKKWSLFTNPYFESYKNNTTGKALNGSAVYWKIAFKYLEIPIGVRHYMYLSGSSKLFINAAYIAALPIGNNGYTYSYQKSFEGYGKLNVSRGSNFALGAGYSYGRYSIEARYNFARQLLSNYTNWSAKAYGFGIIAGYQLF